MKIIFAFILPAYKYYYTLNLNQFLVKKKIFNKYLKDLILRTINSIK
jgi:hypothetical protein